MNKTRSILLLEHISIALSVNFFTTSLSLFGKKKDFKALIILCILPLFLHLTPVGIAYTFYSFTPFS